MIYSFGKTKWNHLNWFRTLYLNRSLFFMFLFFFLAFWKPLICWNQNVLWHGWVLANRQDPCRVLRKPFLPGNQLPSENYLVSWQLTWLMVRVHDWSATLCTDWAFSKYRLGLVLQYGISAFNLGTLWLSGFLPWVRNLQAQGTSFPIVQKSQWWFHSFSLKYINTMTVIVKNHVDQAAADKSSLLHTENVFAFYW